MHKAGREKATVTPETSAALSITQIQIVQLSSTKELNVE
jgi:hypothetical protein